jgi:DNA-directed RNA polymerase subunit M/transcription elongation factor TFIIS
MDMCMEMRFCEKCGSRMIMEKRIFSCPKCGNTSRVDLRIQSKSTKAEKVEQLNSVYVVNNRKDEYVKISQICSECGNDEAFHWFSRVSGEHAGVGTERTVEHFRCTKCSHSWNKSS